MKSKTQNFKKMYSNAGKLAILFSMICVVFFTACDPNDNDGSDPVTDEQFAQNFGNSVQRSFMGQIVDENDHPLQNVAVVIGTSTAQTDINGIFIIHNAPVHEKFAYITANKSGYFEGSRSLVPTSGMNRVKIMMISSTPTATISTGEVSDVALPNGTTVTFDGGFEDENGNLYSGTVNVSMYHLSASNPNISDMMPGMLYGRDETGNQKGLVTFGMLNVELRGSAGQKLEIADGHTAGIKMAIDPAQVGTSPSSIPLWHFDADAGYWKQDGTATKQGNFYIGEVSHFSWWNCDAPVPVINLNMRVVDADGNPLSGTQVVLSFESDWGTNIRAGYTDENGNVSGKVPSNELITMKITLYGLCSQLNVSTIGPFNTDVDLGDVTATGLNQVLSTINGSLATCSGSPVTSGYVYLSSNVGSSFATVTNGNFSLSFLSCDPPATFKLIGTDYENLAVTDTINYTATPPVTEMGTIPVCNAVTEFISYTIDDESPQTLISNINAYWIGVENFFNISGTNAEHDLYLSGNTMIPGNYTTADNFVLYIDNEIYTINIATPNDVIFHLSSFGQPGEYIDMTFNGSFTDSGTTHTISGTIHVKRT